MTGEKIIESMLPMHDRSNGLGGGFAGYGIYPEYKEFYAFHVFYDNNDVRLECEKLLKEGFEIVKAETMPIRLIPEITDIPLIWRYFIAPLASVLSRLQLDEKEHVARTVTHINTKLDGAYVFSSGKNMGTFKAVGFPEDVGRFYRLEEYEAYSWTAHGRYPTNTPGWWGGAHPFSLLDYSIVHNGEISSYDANRRYIEMFGYKCTLLTDTEVITYIADYLLRRKGLTLEETASVIAAPFWSTIKGKEAREAERLAYLRKIFPSLLITGPFSIILGFGGGLMALNDRLKLRSMVVAEKGDRVFIASEEAAIRVLEPDAENVYAPMGGEAVIVKVKEGAY
jgi:glutamate synthase domain-containing protein 1